MTEYKIKGHEKFPLRDGWLTKGMQAVREPSRIFTSDEGPDVLGVGTNMVKSIRYWMQAFGLITENVKTGSELSELGQLVLKYDEFIEDPFTVWILQSNISQNSKRATTWYLYFNACEAEEFHKDEVFEILKKELISFIGTDTFPDSSLKDDIDVLLNMYSKTNDFDDPEDKNRSPLASLGLLRKDKDLYIRKQPDLRMFSPYIILYEISGLIGTDVSISIDTISKHAKNLFQINRVSLNNYLDYLENAGFIKVDRTAGLDVIYPVGAMKSQKEIIEDYYQSR